MARDREATIIRDGFYREDCPECDHGWVQVHPRYAEGLVPGDLAAEHAALVARSEAVEQFGSDDPTLDEDWRAYGERWRLRELWTGAVYPCPECRRTQYDRWRAGCYRANHHRKSCKVCGPDAVKRLEADEPVAAGEQF